MSTHTIALIMLQHWPLLDPAPLPRISNTLLDGAAFAISGSRIYVLGGFLDHWHETASADVYSIDWDGSESSSCWIKGTPMLYPRAKPTCTIVDGKVYVFGGLNYDWLRRDRPFGGVFDPATEKWEALPQIPDDEGCTAPSLSASFSIMATTVAGGDGKRYIPVHLSGSYKLMGLRLEDKSWFCMDHAFCVDPEDPYLYNLVLVDDEIYSICDSQLQISAYHLPTKQFLRVLNNLTPVIGSPLIYVGHNNFWLRDEGFRRCFGNYKVHKNFNGSNLESISLISVSCVKFRLDCNSYCDIKSA